MEKVGELVPVRRIECKSMAETQQMKDPGKSTKAFPVAVVRDVRKTSGIGGGEEEERKSE